MVSALADCVGDANAPVAVAKVRRALARVGVQWSSHAVAATLERLRLAGIVQGCSKNGRRYKLALGLYAHWLRAQHVLLAVAHNHPARQRTGARAPAMNRLVLALVGLTAVLAGLAAWQAMSTASRAEDSVVAPAPDSTQVPPPPVPEPESKERRLLPPEPGGEPMTRHEYPQYGYAVNLPEGWTIQLTKGDKDDDFVACMRCTEQPDSTRVEILVEYSSEEHGGSTGAVSKGQQTLAKDLQVRYGQGYRERGNIPAEVKGADEVVRWEFDLDREEVTLRKIITFASRGTNGYGVLCQAPARDWARYALLFERALSSLELMDVQEVLKPSAVLSSSVRNDNYDLYGPAKAVDGLTSTSWQADNDARGSDGSGEWTYMKFRKACRIQAVRILPGYAKEGKYIEPRLDRSLDLFIANTRPRTVTLRLEDGLASEHSIADRPVWQTLELPPAAPTLGLRLTVTKVYRGEPYGDLAITEIQVLGERTKSAMPADRSSAP